MNERSTFGLGLLFTGILVTAGLVALWKLYPLAYWPGASTWLPGIGVGLSGITLVVAYVSYPRVHNLKVQVLGYGIAVAGLGYLTLRVAYLQGLAVSLVTEVSQTVLPTALYVQVVVVLAISAAVPGIVKYRISRVVALVLVAAQIVLYAVAVGASVWAQSIVAAAIPATVTGLADDAYRPLSLTLATVSVVVLVIAVVKERHSFGLGGLHAGAVFVAAVGWLMPDEGEVAAHILGQLVFAGLAAYSLVGILAHWFARIENRASYDPLLRIYNREYCQRVLNEQSRINTRPPFSIALCDLDHFKSVNDTHGHEAGDHVLVSVAQRVQKAVVPDGIAARYGGEELVVFLPNTDRPEAKKLLESIRKDVEAHPVKYQGKTIPVTVSIGLSSREGSSQSLRDVLVTADRALYRAKAQGRNRIRSGAAK